MTGFVLAVFLLALAILAGAMLARRHTIVGALIVAAALGFLALAIASEAHAADPSCYRKVTAPAAGELCRTAKLECFVGVDPVKHEAACGFTLTKKRMDTLFRRTVVCGAEVWGFCPSFLPFDAVDAIRGGIMPAPPRKEEK